MAEALGVAALAAAVLAGAVASVAGFGIGSILTPVIASITGTKLAIALVSFPHFAATLLRWWMLRRDVDNRLLRTFGAASALGGVTGALLYGAAASRTLSFVFALLLIFAGISGMTGLSRRMRTGPTYAWLAGAMSGVLGGIAGNQGGIRSAALLSFSLTRQAFVATATATALLVDIARLPVYVWTAGSEMRAHVPLLTVMVCGALLGTMLGERTLRRIPERLFQQLVGALIAALGAYMLIRANAGG